MRTRFKRLVLLSLGSLLTAVGCAARADTDSEREALARISHELERLQAMVAASTNAADTTSRVKFRYDWLQQDLEMVRRGVTDHLDAPRQPRPVPPLRGDYRR
jgi:RAQPRD family integrative conjugative element protein